MRGTSFGDTFVRVFLRDVAFLLIRGRRQPLIVVDVTTFTALTKTAPAQVLVTTFARHMPCFARQQHGCSARNAVHRRSAGNCAEQRLA